MLLNHKYRLERLIGAGGMAAVYEAVHRNGNRVAIKMLHPLVSADMQLRARFLREGYVANRVEHRGAVKVLDDDAAEDGSVFLVMELLQGETLDSRTKRSGGRLGDREVCDLTFQLLDVLGAAHAKGIVHRDIKPENLFLTSEGQLKVLDFGIARLREAPGSQGATSTGHLMGTPAFMAPEQALGRSRLVDGQTDLYAAGATMFTMLTGRYVHASETIEEMLILAGTRPAPPVATLAPFVPPGIAAVIDGALAFEKERRWPSAQAMSTALADAYRASYAGAPAGAPHAAFGAATTQLAPGPGSTTGGVSSQGRAGAAGTAAQRTSAGPKIGVAIALAVTLASGATFFAMKGGATRGPQASPTGTETGSSVGPIPTVTAPAASATASPEHAAAAIATASAATAAATATATASAAATATATASAATAAATAAFTAATPTHKPPEPPRPPPPEPASTHAVSCDPPYTIDAAGHHQYKPECLK
jgi:serine/threonine-protein kinase